MEINKKNIWLINQVAMPPEFESRLRTIKFAQYLTKKGYNVTVFSSSVMHNMDIDLINDDKKYIERNYGDIKFVHIKTIKYKKNGLSRFVGLLEFPIKLHFLRNKFDKPDFFIQTASVPFNNISYYTAKKLKSTFIVDVQDLWPESFVDLGIISKHNPLLYFAYLAEKWLYTKAEKVIFSQEGGKDYIIDKKWDINNGGPIDLHKIFHINNGVDLNNYKIEHKLEDSDLENNDIKKIIYIGSIRLANNLIELIKAAKILKDYSDIKFLIYGDGDNRETLELFCKKEKLDNVIFKQKWIDPHYLPYLLSKSSVNILNYKSGSFGKYGGSQSKLFQYLASGNPICANIKTMYCLINKHKLGIAREFSSNNEYAEAILELLNLKNDEKIKMKERMQKVVKEFNYEVLTKKLIDLL